MKNTYYFSHDSNARHDPKLKGLVKQYGVIGYGVYFMLVEIMMEQYHYKLHKFPKLLEGVAADIQIEEKVLQAMLQAMLHEYHLLSEDENYIWSESLLRRMKQKDAKLKAKREAGRLGGVASGISRRETKQTEALLEANEQKERKGKERKGKEIKVKEDNIYSKPTLAEIKAYCQERKNTVNPERFFSHYESNGWRIGKNPMKNWKAAIHTWEHNDTGGNYGFSRRVVGEDVPKPDKYARRTTVIKSD